MLKWKGCHLWPLRGSARDRVELGNILAGRFCCSLQQDDVLAWTLDPRGVFLVAARYRELDRRKYGEVEIPWWKYVWNKFSWPK